MSLAEQLDKIREASATRRSPEERAVMGKATEALRRSGILDRVVKVGEALPAFSLMNAQGKRVRAADLLAQGPVVLTVFRGVW